MTKKCKHNNMQYAVWKRGKFNDMIVDALEYQIFHEELDHYKKNGAWRNFAVVEHDPKIDKYYKIKGELKSIGINIDKQQELLNKRSSCAAYCFFSNSCLYEFGIIEMKIAVDTDNEIIKIEAIADINDDALSQLDNLIKNGIEHKASIFVRSNSEALTNFMDRDFLISIDSIKSHIY